MHILPDCLDLFSYEMYMILQNKQSGEVPINQYAPDVGEDPALPNRATANPNSEPSELHRHRKERKFVTNTV